MRISALYFCASHGLEVPAQLLIDAGADLDTFNDEFSNPLHVASQTGHPKMVQLLIDAGALINARRPDSGSTPLITAAQKNRADVVALLIAAGAPLEDGVPNGNTALGVAVDKGWVESASLLLEAGANPQASFMYQGRKWTAEENARDELSRSDGPPGCDWRECIRLLQHHTAMRSMHGTPKAAQHVMKWSDEID
jgi:ankyrin repeat protein